MAPSNISIIAHFSSLPDPRSNINRAHRLIDILVISLCAVISNCEGYNEIEAYGKNKLDWFKTFLELPNGIPSHDTFRAVFQSLDFVQFQKCFLGWMKDVFQAAGRDIIAIDGKTSCASHDRKSGKKALHMVSAFCAEQGVILGQVKTDEKSNEITAIPELIALLDIKGAIVTIDAMGCQEKIVEAIVAKGADYVIGLKDNQKTLCEKAETVFKNTPIETLPQYIEEEKSAHGRTERREYYLVEVPGNVNHKYLWSKLKSFGMVISERLVNGVLSRDTRYFVTSLEGDVQHFAKAARSHWAIENNLHWSLDVVFREDECRKRAGQSPENNSLIRRFVLNLLKNEKTQKCSMRMKRKIAGWDNDYLLRILGVGI